MSKLIITTDSIVIATTIGIKIIAIIAEVIDNTLFQRVGKRVYLFKHNNRSIAVFNLLLI